MADIRDWFYDRNADPDFKQIVEKSLWLFTVLTGVDFSFYVKDFVLGTDPKILQGFAGFPLWSRVCVAVTVATLVLRYVVGSAVHLNARYVPKTTQSLENSIATDAEGRVLLAPNAAAPRRMAIIENKAVAVKSLGRLYVDIAILVAFGGLAINLTFAPDLNELMWRCLYFVGAGFVWGVFALRRAEDRDIARRWIVIDFFQGGITAFLLFGLPSHVHSIDLAKTAILAVVYAGFLLIDFAVVSRPQPPKKAPGP